MKFITRTVRNYFCFITFCGPPLGSGPDTNCASGSRDLNESCSYPDPLRIRTGSTALDCCILSQLKR
jgi:hypothetical protein